MNLKLSFSWVGIVIFALPMLINIAYAVFPPTEKSGNTAKVARWVEITEQISRIAYLFAVTFLVSVKPLNFNSLWLYLSACFLILYYVVWLRYFLGGRKTILLGKKFLFVPIPLAVFPVLYFLFAAIWLNNILAAAIIIIFGAAHITVSVQSFNQ